MIRSEPKVCEIPLWRLGFRPFFLLAAFYSSVIIILWVAVFIGVARPVGFFNPILWHAHEMIYGYSSAVIAGFVLTASQNWTGIRGIHGTSLKVLVLLWTVGRLSMSISSHPNLVTSALDLIFYPYLAITMLPYFKPADMKIERIFLVYFLLYFVGNTLMHLEALNIYPGLGLSGALLGLNVSILMIIFMGGRVIPFFTESELSKHQPRTYHWIEIASHTLAWGFVISQFFSFNGVLSAIIAFLTALIHLVRLWGWQVPRVRRIPLLWVLHLAYLWIVLGFFLFGLVSLNVIPLGAAVHAFSVGGLGAMTYGMMSRVSLGHTGRKLHPRCIIVIGYLLLIVASGIRVLGPVVFPTAMSWSIAISGLLWATAFICFLTVYMPMLTTARVDGKNG